MKKKPMPIPQSEMPGMENVFNLAIEIAVEPLRNPKVKAIECQGIEMFDEPSTIKFETLTKDEAGMLTPAQAAPMVGPWWFGNEGTFRNQTSEGRQQIHRAWLRHIYNSDSSPIPTRVLESHAMEQASYLAHCWFARELYERLQKCPHGHPIDDCNCKDEQFPAYEHADSIPLG